MTAIASTGVSSNRRAPVTAPTGRRVPTLGLRITFSGLLFVGVLVLICLAALNSEANLLLLLFGIGVGALVVNVVMPIRSVRKIEVDRVAPEAVVAGRPFSLVYVVRNRRDWRRAWSLVVGEIPLRGGPAFPQAFVPILRPGAERRVEMVGNCSGRARLNLRGIRVMSRFPFGLFSCTVELKAPAELTVYPAIGRLRRDPFKSRRYDRSSRAKTTREQENEQEFFGIREYREGDNYRWIHWRRSARTGELVVREMLPLRQTRLIVMLDPWPGHAGAGRAYSAGAVPTQTAAERVISAAATMICDGFDRGHRVGLICRSRVPLVLAPAGGRPHQRRLLEELALISPGGDTPFDELVLRVRWAAGWNARCMILTPMPDATHDRVLSSLGGRTEAVLAISPRSEGFDSLFDMTSPSLGDRGVR